MKEVSPPSDLEYAKSYLDFPNEHHWIFVFSGYTECVDDNIEILVPDDDDGLYAIDILDPSSVR